MIFLYISLLRGSSSLPPCSQVYVHSFFFINNLFVARSFPPSVMTSVFSNYLSAVSGSVFLLYYLSALLAVLRIPAGQSICLLCYQDLLWYCWWAWLSVGSVCLEYSLYTVFSAPRFVWYTSTAFSSLSKLKIKINSGTTAGRRKIRLIEGNAKIRSSSD